VNGAVIKQNAIWDELTIAVPVYSRPAELRDLLRSVHDMDLLPGEIVLCEDHSPERQVIRQIAAEWEVAFGLKGCALQYVENEINLGYDGNVRKLFSVSTRRWVMLLGNDDVVLPAAIPALQQFVVEHPEIRLISRSFQALSREQGV